MEKKTIRLTEKEAGILRDLSLARMRVLETGDAPWAEDGALLYELDEGAARHAGKVFNFYQCAYDGNVEGVKRQTAAPHKAGANPCRPYDDSMIPDYRRILSALMQERYTDEDITKLQYRLKGFIRQQKSPAPRILYIADCHFSHRRLNTEMDYRGFPSVEAMNEHMTAQWNGKVTSRDTVYILGDFSMADGFQTSGMLENLNGKKHLIIGNHDKRYLEDKFFENRLILTQQSYAEIRDHGRTVILSHYPIFCYRGQYRRDREGRPLTYMLYGHVHNTHDEKLMNHLIMETRKTMAQSRHASAPEPIPCNMINCFCMFSDYQPMTLNEWIEIDRRRRDRLNREGS